MPSRSEEKANRILAAALQVLARNGYEQTTINEVADAAKVSRGLLHYYFKDKEEMVSKALTFGFGSMWDSSIGSLSESKTPEELVDNMIKILIDNTQKNPDFSALLFEMWVSSRRSKRIEKVFSDGLAETISRLKTLLDLAAATGVIKIDRNDTEAVVRILLAMYHGLAIQLLTQPEKIKDKKLWIPIRKILLSTMKGQGLSIA
jgi:AcrR family transcriptional regulator